MYFKKIHKLSLCLLRSVSYCEYILAAEKLSVNNISGLIKNNNEEKFYHPHRLWRNINDLIKTIYMLFRSKMLYGQ